MATSIRMASPEDATALLSIYAPLVRETAITFELEPPAVHAFRQRILDTLVRHPWLACEHDGNAIGYAYASPHRARAAYSWSVETSTYVRAAYRRRGVARALYRSLVAMLKVQGFYTAYAGTTLPNLPSVALHQSLGFKPVGTFHGVGYKLGKWHDVAWWQLPLQHDYATAIQPPRTPQELAGETSWKTALHTGIQDLNSLS